MMHTIIKGVVLTLLLLLVAFTARAEVTFQSANKGGGKIVLTLRKPAGCAGLMAMYSYAGESGKTFDGCWTYQDGLIQVVYLDGDRRVYSPDAFTKVGEDAAKPSRAM